MTYQKTLLFPVLLLFLQTAAAQTRQKDPDTGKFGYVDREGATMIPFEYEQLIYISDSFLVARKGGLKGVVDKNGRTIVPFEYQEIKRYSELYSDQFGYAMASKDPKNWGMLDGKGRLVLPLTFEYVRVIGPDLLAGRKHGDTILQFFNGRGELLFKTPGRKAMAGFNKNRDIPEWSFQVEKPDGQTRFMSFDGTWIFPESLKNPLWTDGKLIIAGEKGRIGMLHNRGDTILPFEYVDIQPQRKGHYKVRTTGGLEGLVGENGQFIIPPAACELKMQGKNPDDVYVARCGNAPFPYKVYDVKGNLLPLPEVQVYSSIAVASEWALKLPGCNPQYYFSAYIKDRNRCFLYSNDGRRILPSDYTEIRYFTDNHPLIAWMNNISSLAARSNALDFQGNLLLPENKYYSLHHTMNPRILYGNLEASGPLGFIHLDDPDNTVFKYRIVDRLTNGYFSAREGNFRVLLDGEGKQIAAGKFEALGYPDFQMFKQFRESKKARGRLIASAFSGAVQYPSWIGINDAGEAFVFEERAAPVVAAKAPVEEMKAPPQLHKEDSPTSSGSAEPLRADRMDIEPEFPGGEAAMMTFISRHLVYPQIARENSIEGTVVMEFVIEVDGQVSNIRVIRDIGNGCGAAAQRMIQAMPKWTPAKKNGITERCKMVQMVKFTLQ